LWHRVVVSFVPFGDRAMDGSFEARKRELEKECVVAPGLFWRSLERLKVFMAPFNVQRSRQGL
jgi:hypothetical protein